MKTEVSATMARGRSARLLHMAAGLCLTALAIAAFRSLLIDVVTVFLEPMLEGLVWLCIILLTLVCLVRVVIRRNARPFAELKALGLTSATFLIFYFVPFTDLAMKANFALHRRSREQLIGCLLSKSCGSLVRSGGRGDLVALPKGSEHLSSGGGEVIIDHRDGRDYILFFTFRGILDRFSGYVYSPTNTAPAKDEFLGKGAEIEKVAPHWYWYAS